VNLLEVVQQDITLRHHSTHDGGEFIGPCPFCKSGEDRFHVWPAKGNYWCRICGAKGDGIQYLCDLRSMSFEEAQKTLGIGTNGNGNGNGHHKLTKVVAARKSWAITEQVNHTRIDYSDGSKSFVWEPAGVKSIEMPLYGAHNLGAERCTVVVTEGEKATDALDEAFITSVGTVCGASATPGDTSLEVLLPHDVVLWPDNDEVGHKHMTRIAAWLQTHGATPRWIDWPDAPAKADAADYIGNPQDLINAARDWQPSADIVTIGNPEFRKLGLAYVYEPTGYEIKLTFDYIRRKGDDITAEVDTEAALPGSRPGRIQRGRVALTSGTAKASHARLLAGISTNEIPWHRLLETASDLVVDAERDGDAFVKIGQREKNEDVVRWAVDMMVPEGKMTFWYGARASCKSQTAALMAVCLQEGLPFLKHATNQCRVGILDYEDDAEAWEAYLRAVSAGLGIETPEVFYRPCRVPLRQQINTVAKMADSEGIGLWIVDSFGLAAGPSGAGGTYEETALGFGAVARELGKSMLVIDHITNAARRDSKTPADPYGSQYKLALARAGFEIQKEQDEGASHAHIGIFDRKHGRLKAISILATWHEDGQLTILPQDARSWDSESALTRRVTSLSQRIDFQLQAKQFQTVEELAERLPEKVSEIRSELIRGQRNGNFDKHPGEKWALSTRRIYDSAGQP
jgi:hypothetical protein